MKYRISHHLPTCCPGFPRLEKIVGGFMSPASHVLLLTKAFCSEVREPLGVFSILKTTMYVWLLSDHLL